MIARKDVSDGVCHDCGVCRSFFCLFSCAFSFSEAYGGCGVRAEVAPDGAIRDGFHGRGGGVWHMTAAPQATAGAVLSVSVFLFLSWCSLFSWESFLFETSLRRFGLFRKLAMQGVHTCIYSGHVNLYYVGAVSNCRVSFGLYVSDGIFTRQVRFFEIIFYKN